MFDVTLDDTPIAVTDSTALSLVYSIVCSDTAAVSDSCLVEMVKEVLVSDTLDISSDQVLIVKTGTVVISETLSLTDSASTSLVYSKAVDETALVLTESLTPSTDYTRLPADTVSVADDLVVEAFFGFNDNIAITDELVASTSYVRDIGSDSLSLTDNVTGEPDVWWNDAYIVTDSTVLASDYARTLTDTLVLTDQTPVTLTIEILATDSLVITQLLEVETVFLQDAVTVTEQWSTEAYYDKPFSETLAVTDQLLADTQYQRSGSDTAAISDTVTAVRERTTNIDLGLDSISVTDSAVRDFTFGRELFDTFLIPDTVKRDVPFIRSANDTVSVTDSVTRDPTFFRNASDSIAIADTSTASLERGVVVSDTLAVTDQLRPDTSYVRDVADALVLSDQTTVLVNRVENVSLADSLSITEFVLAEVIDVDVEANDTVFLTDIVARETTAARTLSDALVVTETILAKLGGEVDRVASDTIAITDQTHYILQPGALSDAVLVSDLVMVERLTPLPVVMDGDGFGLTIDLPTDLRYTRLVPDSFHFQALDRGVSIQVEEVLPSVTEIRNGYEGTAVNQSNPNFVSTLFRVTGASSTSSSTVSGKTVTVEEDVWIGDSYRIDVLGPNSALRVDDFDGSTINQYIEISNGEAPGIYRVVAVPNQYSVLLDRPLPLIDPSNGHLQWRLTTAVETLHFRTSSKITNQANYDFRADNLVTQAGQPFSAHENFYTAGIDGPKVDSVDVGDDGVVVVHYDQPMQADHDLVYPAEYTITGPTDVMVQRAWSIGRSAVALEVLGLSAGSYSLNVNVSGTPHDLAGNPVDPLFNEAIFTGLSPLTPRSIFTDKGPISKPGLTLQAGFGAIFSTITEVTLPGASMNSSHIGFYIKLGAMGLAPSSSSTVVGKNVTVNDAVTLSELLRVELSGSSTSVYATTGGIFQIVGVISATRVRLQASLNVADPASGTLYWELINPRNGEIADDPADVTVKVNGTLVAAEAVIGLLGQVVLADVPLPTDDVKVDYSWVCNPTVEYRRLNSKEFRLNCWNNDAGVGPTKSQHRYRYNNTLIRPSDYTALDMLATLDQPEQRELHYRAYERAYTPVLNDPTKLLLNSPIHRIAFPSAQRTLAEQFVAYEGTVLPQDDSWEQHGTGTASVSAGVLTVIDDTSGPFPVGQPFFWTHDLDLTFPHAFAMSWRFSISLVPVLNGIFTGLAAGYADDKAAYVVGFLDDVGVKKIGFLKRDFGDDPSGLSAWTGGLDNTLTATGIPVEFDWSILHSYRIFRDLNGTVRLFVDGDVVETLRITPVEAPFLEELNAPFDEIQGAFFGSLSREAENESKWDFVRYLILPTNPLQTAPSSFASYEADVTPELASKPWTPVGFHGTETILGTNILLLDSTSATDAPTASQVGLMGGDFKGFVRMEPLLSMASNVTVDISTQLRTHTHGVDPYGLMFAVDDGSRLMQVAFFPDRSTPKLSYGGRSLPGDFSPYVWSSLGGATGTMMGRILQITDASVSDGLVYFIEDLQPLTSDDRVVSSSIDYIQEFRCQVMSHTSDISGFAGAFGQVFDGTRALGVMLEDVSGTLYATLHSDGVVVTRFAFNWNDGAFHTYRISKSTTGNLVTLFIDGIFTGSAPYSNFTASGGTAMISFGSSTPSSNGAISVVDWAYCNVWRLRDDLRHYVGIWKGSDSDSLIGYHLPLKTSGRNAQVVGNALGDSLADFFAANVLAGDRLIVDVGPNKGVYEVAGVSSSTSLTIVGTWPLNPTLADYRIAKETDWTSQHKYRLLRGSTGEVSLFFESDNVPLFTVGYNSIDLPTSGTGIIRTLTNGLPAIAFGSFDSENLEQSSWDFVRYGITRSPSEVRIAPHHQFINQWNVMESPERLFTALPHSLTSFKSSSTGIVPKKDPDFLATPALRAFTILNEDTPLVPSTQTYQVRSPQPSQIYNGSLNNPEDVLNAPGGFILNDASFQIRLVVPEDILYSALDVIEQSEGEEALIAPFGDCCGPDLGGLQYVKETCLVYDADGGVVPENDTMAPTPWTLASDIPGDVFASVAGGVLTYGTIGSKTVYRNNTTLPDAPGLQTEASFRLRLKDDATLGTGDTQVRFGLSAPGLTAALAFVTTPLAERYVIVFDLNNGSMLGSISFDFLDGLFHTYRIVRDPGAGVVRVSIDRELGNLDVTRSDVMALTDDVDVVVFSSSSMLSDPLVILDSVLLSLEYSLITSDSVSIGDIALPSVFRQASPSLDSMAVSDSVVVDGSFEKVPADLVFSETDNITYFDVQPSALISVNEPFNSDTGQFTRYTENTQGTFTVSGGQATIVHPAGGHNDIIVEGADIGMPQVMVQIQMVSRSGSPSGFDNIGVGIAKDANNFIWAGYDAVNHEVRIQTKIAGVNNFNAPVTVTYTAPFTLGLSIVANSATVWVDTGLGWTVATSYTLTPRINMKTANLTGWKGAFTMATPGNSTWVFDNFKVGRFGGVGLRDFTTVCIEDGSPVITANVVQLVTTAVDPQGTGYMGVFSLNLVSKVITQDSVIMIDRGSAIQNDLAGHIIKYGNGDRRLFVSTWGNGFGGVLQVRHKLETAELLSGSHVVSGTTALSLAVNPVGGGNYDPFVAKSGSTWLVGYAVTDDTTFAGSPFYASLDTSPDLVTFTNVGNDSANKPYEGTRLLKAAGAYWVLAGGATTSRIYNSSMTFIANVNAAFHGGSDTQPHPLIFPFGSKQMLVTFDNSKYAGGAFTWGHVRISEADRYY